MQNKDMKIKVANHNATLVTFILFFLLSGVLKVFNTKFAISRHITSFFITTNHWSKITFFNCCKIVYNKPL